jgi:predicted restriction endonuclease
MVKKATGYRCQLGEALGLPPHGFKKPNGVPYVEAHHVMPVSKLKIGSLSLSNILTLCANLHKQMHYRCVSVEIGEKVFEIVIEGQQITMSGFRSSRPTDVAGSIQQHAVSNV